MRWLLSQEVRELRLGLGLGGLIPRLTASTSWPKGFLEMAEPEVALVQGADGCPCILVTELVMQSVMPATVSTMPANAPGIMGRN